MSTLRRVIIATKKAPDAIGPYNQVLLKHVMVLLWILINHFQAVQVDSTLYISGQIGFIPSKMQVTVKQSKHLKGRLGPPVSDVTFLHQRRSVGALCLSH